MLQNIKPQPKGKKSGEGALTAAEKPLAKGLLKLGYRAQDITFIVNQGRSGTVNQARVSQVGVDPKIVAASSDDVMRYLVVQAAYDPKTLLNPYKDPRLVRAREAMMAAVQAFNNPTRLFKLELFSVLANIAWTYLLHEKLERTKAGSSKLVDGSSVTVGGTLGKGICPIIDKAVVANLKKLIEVRDAVEHTFFVGGEVSFGPLFQACCVNFDNHMTEWFGEHLSLSGELSLALQFAKLGKQQLIELENSVLPASIKALSKSIQDDELAGHNAFQLNVYYASALSNKTKADIHKLVAYDDNIPHDQIVIKKVDYHRKSGAQIAARIRELGFPKIQRLRTSKSLETKMADCGDPDRRRKGLWRTSPEDPVAMVRGNLAP